MYQTILTNQPTANTMKTYIRLIGLSLFAALIAPLASLAADAAAIAADPNALGDPWGGIILLVTPFIVSGVKWLLPKIPTKFIPLIAGAVGLVLTLPAYYLAGIDVNWWQGLLLGLGGVGLREIYDQMTRETHTVEQNEAGKT